MSTVGPDGVSSPPLPSVPDSRLNPQELLSSLAQRGVAVNLPTLDLCFLMALHLHGQRVSLSSFSEGALVDAFERVCAAVAPVTGTHPRATHAIANTYSRTSR